MKKAPPRGTSSEFHEAGQSGNRNDPMNEMWNDLVGVSLAHRYVLEECLSAGDGDAWYKTHRGDRTPAAVRVMREDSGRLAMWRRAAEVDHPNLVRLYDAGRTQSKGVSLIYMLCEYPDEFLAGILQERALSAEEAKEVLRAVLGGLRYLHGCGLAHGAVDAGHIMSFGDAIKLQSDTWEAPRSGGRRRKLGPYDAPETLWGTVSPASDMWSLGVTLHEVLTGRRPNLESDSEFASIPEPFATVLGKTLVRSQEARWTVEDVEGYVFPGERPPEAVASPAAKPVASDEPPGLIGNLLHQAMPMWGVPVAGLVAALALGFLFLRQPAMTPAAAPPSVTRQAASGERPSAMGPAAKGKGPAEHEESRWRVIAFTYMQRSMAQQKADELNARQPGFMAEVFTPGSDSGPYMISLGGRMTRSEAQELLKEAREKGFPRDTFVRNFVK